MTLSWQVPTDDASAVDSYQILRRLPVRDPVGSFEVIVHDHRECGHHLPGLDR